MFIYTNTHTHIHTEVNVYRVYSNNALTHGFPVAQSVRASSRYVVGGGFYSPRSSKLFSKSKSLNFSCDSAKIQKSEKNTLPGLCILPFAILQYQYMHEKCYFYQTLPPPPKESSGTCQFRTIVRNEVK